MKKAMGIIAVNLGSTDESRNVGGHRTKVACTLLQRDYKGLSNYGSNAAVVRNDQNKTSDSEGLD